MWMNLQACAPSVKVIGQRDTAYQRATTTEEALEERADKMTRPGDLIQPLLSAASAPARWAHE